MIVNIGLFASFLASMVWLFLYPFLFINFVLGGEMRSSLAGTKILFGAGAVWWMATLFIALNCLKTIWDNGSREIEKETHYDEIRGKEDQIGTYISDLGALFWSVTWVAMILAWAFSKFGN